MFPGEGPAQAALPRRSFVKLDPAYAGELNAELGSALLDPLQVAHEQRAALLARLCVRHSKERSWGGRSPRLRRPPGSAMAAPRSCRSSPLAEQRRAAVAPSATTRRADQARSCSIHQRQAAISPRIGLLVDAPLAAPDEFEMLDRVGDVDRRAVDPGLRPAPHRKAPAGPTNGRPARSSWSPGCSPTNMIAASSGPRRTRSGSHACKGRSACICARPSTAPPPRCARGSGRAQCVRSASSACGKPFADNVPTSSLQRVSLADVAARPPSP